MSQWIDYRRAIDLIRQKRLDDALAVLLKLEEQHPRNLLALAAIGHILFEKQSSERSDDYYLRTRKLLREFRGGLSDLQEGDLRSLELASRRALQAEARVFSSLLSQVQQEHRVADADLVRFRNSIAAYSQGSRPASSSALCQPELFHIADFPEQAFPRLQDYPRISELRDMADIVSAELADSRAFDELLVPYVNYRPDSYSASQWQELNDSKTWSVFHLYKNGVVNPAALESFPKTLRCLDAVGMMSLDGYAPNAMLSVLNAGGYIKPHFGSVNGRLIVHLPLEVPEDCGYLEVAGQRRPWIVGEPIIFDDSLQHSALNQSTRRRIVLIFDIWHRELASIERLLLSNILKWMATSSGATPAFAA